jgi:hypothetical protein
MTVCELLLMMMMTTGSEGDEVQYLYFVVTCLDSLIPTTC